MITIDADRRTRLITRLSAALCVWVVIDLARHRLERSRNHA